MSIVSHNVNDVIIIRRESDGYLNATQLCRSFGKFWGDYYRLESTKELIKSLSEQHGIPENQLVICKKGGVFTEQHTYVHPLLAPRLNEWARNKKRSHSAEQLVRDSIQVIEGGVAEAVCHAGSIDLLTDNEIIEVKTAKNWKSAIGQVIVYGAYYPHKRKRIHLFNLKNIDLAVVKEHCDRLGIRLTIESP